jgi:hypothetical protein
MLHLCRTGENQNSPSAVILSGDASPKSNLAL